MRLVAGVLYLRAFRMSWLPVFAGAMLSTIVVCASDARSENTTGTVPNNVKYVSSIEGKQESLVCVREDIQKLEMGFHNKLPIQGEEKLAQPEIVSRMELTGIDLVELLPTSAPICLEAHPMLGTLSPRTKLTDTSSGDKEAPAYQ